MLLMIAIIIAVIINFILYFLFGTAVLYKKGVSTHFMHRIMVGFFAYYAIFFVFCVPVMKYYRPLSMLTWIWAAVVAIISAIGVFLIVRERMSRQKMEKPQSLNAPSDLKGVLAAVKWVKANPLFFAGTVILILIQVVLVSCTYNFTLDAAYYVAGISTNIDTNMINVYDPFTGAWQDHFEMRYFFATYSVQDAVVCQLTGLSPLIWTKSVMSTVIILLTNMVYYLIASHLADIGILFGGSKKEAAESSISGDAAMSRKRNLAVFLMMALMFFVNITFNTIYTSSLFLMTRTYEGKAIVGNLAIFGIFLLFLRMVGNENTGLVRPWLSIFLICFGASTISSTANMLMPVELTVLFLPLIIWKKSYGWIPKYIACVIPGIVFSLAFVLYVKGYFVFYTYPR